jgi:hypothetical protein
VKQPLGYITKGQENKVYRLNRALYGLKQAGHIWWLELKQSMKDLGFSPIYSDPGLYKYSDKQGNLCIALIYVDNALFCGPNQEFVQTIKNKFMSKWECRDLGDVKDFLGMNITQKGKSIYIDQKSYIIELVKQFKLENSNPVSTPLPIGYVPLENKNPIDEGLKSRYQSILGSILWIMLGSRLDIAFATVKMAQFANNPSQEHLDKLRWIVKYLNSTQHFRIVYNGESNSGLIAYCDSDHASDPNH